MFHTLPRSAPAPVTRPGSMEGPDGFEAFEFDFARRVPVEVLLRIPEDADGPALLHIAAPGEDPASIHRLLRNVPRFGRNPVLVVHPPGTGSAVWPKSEWKMLLRNAMQTGRTVDFDPRRQRAGRRKAA